MPSQTPTDTRERLLETAATLMWERSYQATGVDELCKQAGAKKGSFYHFFRSKTELAIAAIERSWAMLEESIFVPSFSSSESGLNQIESLFRKIYEFQESAVMARRGVLGCPFGNLGQEMARQDEQIVRALQQIVDAHCQYLERAFARAELAGEIPAGDNKQRAKNLFALMQGALLLAKMENDLQVFEQVIQTAGFITPTAVPGQPADAATVGR